MERRDVVKLITLATGATVTAPLVSSIFLSCQEEVSKEKAYKLKYFSEDDFKWVTNIADTIIPKTDSPSATEVKVPELIDHMLAKVYSSENADLFESNFMALKNYLNSASEAKFLDLKDEERLQLLKKLDKSTQSDHIAPKAGLIEIKQQTIGLYLTSEVIATKYLNYLPIPGPYIPCISLEETGGKAWAI